MTRVDDSTAALAARLQQVLDGPEPSAGTGLVGWSRPPAVREQWGQLVATLGKRRGTSAAVASVGHETVSALAKLATHGDSGDALLRALVAQQFAPSLGDPAIQQGLLARMLRGDDVDLRSLGLGGLAPSAATDQGDELAQALARALDDPRDRAGRSADEPVRRTAAKRRRAPALRAASDEHAQRDEQQPRRRKRRRTTEPASRPRRATKQAGSAHRRTSTDAARAVRAAGHRRAATDTAEAATAAARAAADMTPGQLNRFTTDSLEFLSRAPRDVRLHVLADAVDAMGLVVGDGDLETTLAERLVTADPERSAPALAASLARHDGARGLLDDLAGSGGSVARVGAAATRDASRAPVLLTVLLGDQAPQVLRRLMR